MNEVIRRKLIEAEHYPGSIEQQYKRVINLDRHQRNSRREEERLRERGETGTQVPRANILANSGEAQRQ